MEFKKFFTKKNLAAINSLCREIETKQKKYEDYLANPYEYEDNERCSYLEDPEYYCPVFKVEKSPVYPPDETYYRVKFAELFPSKCIVFEEWYKLTPEKHKTFVAIAHKVSQVYLRHFGTYPPFILNIFW